MCVPRVNEGCSPRYIKQLGSLVDLKEAIGSNILAQAVLNVLHHLALLVGYQNAHHIAVVGVLEIPAQAVEWVPVMLLVHKIKYFVGCKNIVLLILIF